MRSNIAISQSQRAIYGEISADAMMIVESPGMIASKLGVEG